jgi:3,4-dihydroxy 2-butanone 4-phosphate synthase
MDNLKFSDPEVKKGVEAVELGEMVFIFDSDSREGETDFVIAASAVTPDDVCWMRRDGGGLICTALADEVCTTLGLPFMADLLAEGAGRWPAIGNTVEQAGDLAYDSRSSFSIWVNHRDTRTGIPDNDRALTINKLAEISEKGKNGEAVVFGDEFRAPGHVALLRAAEGLVENRRGQTELSVALAQMAGITPVMVVCEMLDDTNGKALSKEDARTYAQLHGCVFLEGGQITRVYKEWAARQKK